MTTNTTNLSQLTQVIAVAPATNTMTVGTGFTVNSTTVNVGSLAIAANGTLGTAGQLLTSNGTSTYWGTGSGTWTLASFSTTINLNGQLYMAPYQISGALAFTPGSLVAGSTLYVQLVADGSHAPTFPGFTEAGGSAGFNNTSGIVNNIQFFYDGAVPYFYATQAIGAVPIAAPTFVSAQVASAAPTVLVITMNQAMNNGVVPAVGAWTITESAGSTTVTSVTITGSLVRLGLSQTVSHTDTITYGYTQPGSNNLQNPYGQLAANVTSQTVTNNT
jgi:hypothetical protein